MSTLFNRRYLLLFLSVFLLISGCTWQSAEILEKKQDLTIKDELERNVIEDGLFYFGYGSNMNKQRMASRCGQEHFEDLGKAYLSDWQFYFYARGYANIKPHLDSLMEGVLYKIDHSCLESLDRVEGYPHVYQREKLNITQGDEIYQAEVYIVKGDKTIGQPSQNYYQVVFTGAVEHNLSVDYVDQIKILSGY